MEKKAKPAASMAQDMQPSNKLYGKGKTYAEIVEAGLNQFRIQSINQGTARGYIDVCIDNVRIYYQKK